MKKLFHASLRSLEEYNKPFSQVFQDCSECSDDLFLLYIAYHFVHYILVIYVLAGYRENNRVKMAASKYQNNMVRMVD